MIYYAQLQKSIEFIEDNLQEDISAVDAAFVARMCIDEYKRLFHAVTGVSVQGYIGRRRVSQAAEDMTKDMLLISDLARSYSFSSPEAFSMIFRQHTGYLPSEYLDQSNEYVFKAIDLMDSHIEKEILLDEEHNDKIMLLKPFDKMRLVSYTYKSDDPEEQTLQHIMKYAKHEGLGKGFRIFGFSPKNSISKDGTYSYTVAVTVDEDHVIKDAAFKEMSLDGLSYAVASANSANVVLIWEKFRNWLRNSNYSMGEHQYLEEHLSCTRWREENPMDLVEFNIYMPIKERSTKETGSKK